MINALVIGCGNMGALYDIDNDAVLTHAKGYALDGRFRLSVFDTNETLANRVASRYGSTVINDISPAKLSAFNCISICTPTDTHVHYLEQAFEAGVKTILCEKPIANNPEALQHISERYIKSGAQVLVNYTRRFQPAYTELKQTIDNILQSEKLTNISVRYQRGFINNCSHAFDTIEFLTGSEMQLSNLYLNNRVADHFETDPTVSLTANWNHTNVNVLGLSNVKFSHFEIDLYFDYHKVCIREAGQTIEVLKAETNERFLQPLKSIEQYTRTQCLKDNMKHVIHAAHDIVTGKTDADNFLRSVSLNQRMINYLSLENKMFA